MQSELTIARSRPIERRPLHEEVADRLRELITEGELPAGARLNERMLCEQLGVSRTPLREAFKVLSAERLIELQPNRGAVVTVLSEVDVVHLFELMAELEGLSGELAAARRTDAELDEIRALHFEMLAAHARRDLSAYYRLNREVHALINRCARNPVLTETYESVNLRIQNLRFRSNFNRDKWDAAVAEHGEIVEALARRDAAALRRLLERHLRSKLDAVLEELRGPRAAAAEGAR
jgi:DNA-binding GntR family transcriptional regulator